MTKIWSEVIAELPLPVRSKWRGGNWVVPVTNPAQFAVPNAWHKKACEEGKRDVEQALSARLGRISVDVVVEGGEGGQAAAPQGGQSQGNQPAPPSDDEMHESIDVSELRDAGDAATGGVELLLREFGGELLEEEP